MTKIYKIILVAALLFFLSSVVYAINRVNSMVDIVVEAPEDPLPTKTLTIKDYIATKDWDANLAYAVMMAESRGISTAININKDGSIDRGFFQLNSKYHPHITPKCAREIICSTDYAYTLYLDRGRTFKAWYGYLNNGYKYYLTF